MGDLLQSLKSGLTNFVNDITNLDVMTLTGVIEVQTSGQQLDLSETYKALATATQPVPGAGGATTSAAVNVVAFTHIDLDKDTVHFVKSSLTDAEQPLLTSHMDMLKSALEARQAFIDTVKDIVRI